jgi:hypothetical protein
VFVVTKSYSAVIIVSTIVWVISITWTYDIGSWTVRLAVNRVVSWDWRVVGFLSNDHIWSHSCLWTPLSTGHIWFANRILSYSLFESLIPSVGTCFGIWTSSLSHSGCNCLRLLGNLRLSWLPKYNSVSWSLDFVSTINQW